MDYLENGNIVNSVNFPAVSLGARKGNRICVIAKADAGAMDKVVEAYPGAEVVCETKGDYTYVLAETSDDIDGSKISGEGIIRVRVIS